MWDTVDNHHEYLSHDLPCPYCGHATHRYLPCDRDCGCRVREAEPAVMVRRAGS